MNSCILMAQIVQEPQLRFTPDQMAIAEMFVQFPGLRSEDPPATLKVVGWGNLAQEIQKQYHQGDHVIIEGRLTMKTVEREQGFKEKRAELTVQRIHSLYEGVSISSSTIGTSNAHSEEPELLPTLATAPSLALEETVTSAPSQSSTYPSLPTPGQDIDDIPF